MSEIKLISRKDYYLRVIEIKKKILIGNTIFQSVPACETYAKYSVYHSNI